MPIGRQKTATISLLAGLLLASATVAQDMKPLGDAMETAARPYPFARCAGLYQGFLLWIGAERMGEDAFQTTDRSYRTMLAVGALLSQQDAIGGTPEHAVEIMVRDALNISDLYIARFEKNYAATGEAFGQDQLVMGDLLVCKDLTEQANAAGF